METVIILAVAVAILYGIVLCFKRNPIVAVLLLIFLPFGLVLWAFVEFILYI